MREFPLFPKTGKFRSPKFNRETHTLDPVDAELRDRKSPDQIASRLQRQGRARTVLGVSWDTWRLPRKKTGARFKHYSTTTRSR